MNLRLERKKSEKDPERRRGERIQREDTGGRGGGGGGRGEGHHFKEVIMKETR